MTPVFFDCILLSMNSKWQYRIIQHNGNYAIYTVSYNDEGYPVSHSPEPVTPLTDNVESLSHQMIHMMSAFTMPVLDAEQFEYNTEGSVDAALDLLKGRK